MCRLFWNDQNFEVFWIFFGFSEQCATQREMCDVATRHDLILSQFLVFFIVAVWRVFFVIRRLHVLRIQQRVCNHFRPRRKSLFGCVRLVELHNIFQWLSNHVDSPCDQNHCNDYLLLHTPNHNWPPPEKRVCRGKSLIELWVTNFLPNWQLPLIFVRFISNF